MQFDIDLARVLSFNGHIKYYKRMRALLADCEFLRECRKDYWTYNHYAGMLEYAASKLRRRAKELQEDIKNDRV